MVKFNHMSRRLIVSYAFAVLLLAGAGYFYYSRTTGPDINIRKFSGVPVSIVGDIVTLRGFFEGSPGTIPDELSSEREFSFKVDGSTGFEKLESYLPDWPEVPVDGVVTSSFNIEDLPNARTSGSLEDITDSTQKGDVIITADFKNSIHNADSPVASFVFYHVLVQPEPRQIQNE